MSLLRKSASTLSSDQPLGALTWFGLGGRARWMGRPTTRAELRELLAWIAAERVPFKVLGRGANVLVGDDGYNGVVIHLDGGEFARVVYDGELVRAGAAVDMFDLVSGTARRGLAGLESLAGIPGSVGGCVRMNAGGRFGEIADVVEQVEVIDYAGHGRTLTKEQVGFAYRHTNLDGVIVVEATLRLTPCDPLLVRQRLHEIRSAKKAEQPFAEHSAGCIFRNPPGASAGQLLDQAGLKGLSCGGARVSERHANFIVADGGARASDVLELINQVVEGVEHCHGVRLDLEIDVW